MHLIDIVESMLEAVWNRYCIELRAGAGTAPAAEKGKGNFSWRYREKRGEYNERKAGNSDCHDEIKWAIATGASI